MSDRPSACRSHQFGYIKPQNIPSQFFLKGSQNRIITESPALNGNMFSQ